MVEPIKKIAGKFGAITIEQFGNTVVVKPKGYVSPRMIRADFEFISNLKEEVDYFVDLRRFILPHPLNLVYLRKIGALPHINSYQVITPLLLKPLFLVLKPIIGFKVASTFPDLN